MTQAQFIMTEEQTRIASTTLYARNWTRGGFDRLYFDACQVREKFNISSILCTIYKKSKFFYDFKTKRFESVSLDSESHDALSNAVINYLTSQTSQAKTENEQQQQDFETSVNAKINNTEKDIKNIINDIKSDIVFNDKESLKRNVKKFHDIDATIAYLKVVKVNKTYKDLIYNLKTKNYYLVDDQKCVLLNDNDESCVNSLDKQVVELIKTEDCHDNTDECVELVETEIKAEVVVETASGAVSENIFENLTVSKASKLLNISSYYVRKLFDRNELAGHKDAHGWRRINLTQDDIDNIQKTLERVNYEAKKQRSEMMKCAWDIRKERAKQNNCAVKDVSFSECYQQAREQLARKTSKK